MKTNLISRLKAFLFSLLLCGTTEAFTTPDLLVNGVVVYGSGSATKAFEDAAGNVDAILTDSKNNNYHNLTADATFSSYVNSGLTASDFENLVSFTPSSSSVLLNKGSKWWTGANPVGADGEPFSDFDTDIGGVQSKHSPFHPSNL